MPQDCCGIRIGIAAWVIVKPELVVAPDLLVSTEAVEHRRPGCGRIHEPMDHQHNDFVRVVRLEPGDTSRLRVFAWVKQARALEFFRVGACEHHGERHREIRSKRKDLPVHPDGFLRERIFEGKHAAATVKTCDRSDAVVGTRWSEVRACLFIHFASNRDNRRADSFTRGAFGDVDPMDVELIRWREIVERWIPLWARVGLVRKYELAIAFRHSERLRPRIEFCVADRDDHASNGEVVCLARSLVVGLRFRWRKAVSAALMYPPSATSGSRR